MQLFCAANERPFETLRALHRAARVSARQMRMDRAALTREVYQMNQRKETQRADCFSCLHFVVTWDAVRPRACRLFGFKSAGLPSALVFQSTGEECKGYVKKETAEKKPTT